MEKVRCGQASPSVLKKEKKKKVKDDMDRLKQAEKKKRRLEKALATSAAIRSELEKKKQKKIEEQQRLDEEGAAIAESVALHVLGGEDLDDSAHMLWNGGQRQDYMDDPRRIGFVVGYDGFERSTFGQLGCASDTYGSGLKWNNWGFAQPVTIGANFQEPYFEERGRGMEITPGFVAAEAFSALQIAEAPYEEPFNSDGIVFNGIIRGNHLTDEVNFYEEY